MEGSLLNSLSEYECQDINPITESEEMFKRMGTSAIAHCTPPKVVLSSDRTILTLFTLVYGYKF